MAQLPPDSQRATWSHSASLAALAWPASVRPLPPRTAPVKAILATVTADVLGLRCRPLMSVRRPLCADSWVLVPRRYRSVSRQPGRSGVHRAESRRLWSGLPLAAAFLRQRSERAGGVLRGCCQYRELFLIAENPSETTSYRCGMALPRESARAAIAARVRIGLETSHSSTHSLRSWPSLQT